jgi:4'-phosphopantetheinyl transferase
MAKMNEIAIDQVFVTPPAAIIQSEFNIDIWKFPTCQDDEKLLTEQESILANRFYQKEDRYRFITGRTALRTLASKYLGVLPQDIEVSFGRNKKPFISNPRTNLCFNLSHSGEWILIAFASIELGIDIEQIKTDFSIEDMMSTYFNKTEQKYIVDHPNPQYAFFILWTRKEALMKAWGTGLQDNLQEISCMDDPQWRIESFRISPEYHAALVYAGVEKNINYYDGNFLLS